MGEPEPPRGIRCAPGWWADLAARYAEPERAYHHLGHVGEVWQHWSWVDEQGLWADRITTWVAVLLHDAVYVPGATDNEARSADLVRPWCERFGLHCDVARAESLILLTARHGSNGADDVDRDAALFLDCDMAILGADPARFDAYSEGVRAEYTSAIPAALYDAGRRAFLEGLRDRSIYITPEFRDRFAASARANLDRALQR